MVGKVIIHFLEQDGTFVKSKTLDPIEYQALSEEFSIPENCKHVVVCFETTDSPCTCDYCIQQMERENVIENEM